MLTNEQIEGNKARFINLVNSIERPGVNKELLLKQLIESDFFTAPASTVFHCGYEGGLCQHSLNVYDSLVKLIKIHYNENECPYTDDTIKIVALFHDFSKMSFYEKYFQNKKIYSPSGSKRDEGGNFDWKSVEAFKVRDAQERFIFGTHGQNAEYMTGRFIPLSTEESAAIINHMGGLDNDTARGSDLTNIYNRYPLACLLHLADMMATYIIERI